MNDRYLAGFINVVECGSFAQAAQRAYITPQALMQQISVLERELGVELLVRTSKGVLPTAAGRALYEGAQDFLDCEADLVKRVHCATAEHVEVVTIGLQPIPMFLPDACLALQRSHPQIELHFVEISQESWLPSIANGTVDIVEYENSNELKNFGLDFTKVMTEPRWCILSPNHPLAQKEVIVPDDLIDEQVIIHNSTWLKSLRKYLRDYNPSIRLTEKPCDMFAVLNTCLRGGIYLAPRPYVGHFAPLVARPFDIPLKWEFGMAHRKEVTPAVRVFLDETVALFENAAEA
ncbi:LysR family transcriptional regulator [Adlercreutzia equolifaciens]|uniref:LysR family transcriptional regulator n=1 Tax=Adlercreutzia equolifaciens TaxID=446660 RepID=UPI0023AEA988|nr:LysR family transcriptional regulator [Adlercreutzia equolifaciens]MDE8701365.1 LysR family transcriptional regulator [Adlercreutzia equolifaciens]